LEVVMSDGMPRRDFVKASAAVAAGLAFVKPGSVYGNDLIGLGIIGCGGRGSGVGGDFLNVGGVRVAALHDLFDDRLTDTRERLDKVADEKGVPHIPDGMLFKGPDAYRKLLAAPGVDAVLITSPPYFHPDHFDAAVAAGKHCWLEKPVATDVHGTRQVEATGRKGAGKVSMTVGFQGRYSEQYQEMVRRIHEGAIGDIVTAQTYYYSGDLKRKGREGASPLENRIRNWVFDRQLSGDILVEQNIHVLDIVNWVTRSHPVSAVATCGKKARLDVDCNDHYNVVYTYPGNVHVTFGSTQFDKSYDSRAQRFMGTKGYAEAHFGKGGVRIVGDNPWDANTEEAYGQAVPRKIAAFLESIRSKNYQNDVASGAESTLTAIMGRTAAYEGEEVTWDRISRSNDRWKQAVDLGALKA
jgi:myo-inositol 2-dehydrogenase / D-chiro-inositol 1-dehydrogenase